MSYSSHFHQIMSIKKGIKQWKEEYDKKVEDILNTELKKYREFVSIAPVYSKYSRIPKLYS